MTKNDMNLIMFKVLAYLYECMVKGVAVQNKNFKVENNFFAESLNQQYLNDICSMLEDKGYTKGFKFANTWGNDVIALSYNAKVTPEGFEYLKENKAMKKIYNYLKEVKGWIPFFKVIRSLTQHIFYRLNPRKRVFSCPEHGFVQGLYNRCRKAERGITMPNTNTADTVEEAAADTAAQFWNSVDLTGNQTAPAWDNRAFCFGTVSI